MKDVLKQLGLGVLAVGSVLLILAWFTLGIGLFAAGHYVASALVLAPFALAFCWWVGKGLMAE